jgi:hypothetical protein
MPPMKGQGKRRTTDQRLLSYLHEEIIVLEIEGYYHCHCVSPNSTQQKVVVKRRVDYFNLDTHSFSLQLHGEGGDYAMRSKITIFK